MLILLNEICTHTFVKKTEYFLIKKTKFKYLILIIFYIIINIKLEMERCRMYKRPISMFKSDKQLCIIVFVIVLGSKWQSRRKILTPTFHFNILQQFVEVLVEESENMTKSLKNTGGTIVKDLVPFVSEHTLNALCGIFYLQLFTTIKSFILNYMINNKK